MGTGSIYKRRNGCWEARLSLGSDKNGKRQSRSFYGSTREEADAKMRNFLLLLRTEVLTEITVKELFRRFLCRGKTNIRTEFFCWDLHTT